MDNIVMYLLFVIASKTYGFQGTFWHICDIHLNISHHSDDVSKFGDYYSDSSYPLFKSAIQNMKSIHPSPDFIIWNGDNVYRRHFNSNKFIQSLQNVSKELHNQFPSINILPSVGNHDVNPSSRFDASDNWCEQLFQHWKFFFTNTTKMEIETFKKGCYYAREIQSKNGTILIVVLNSMLWYRPNHLVHNLSDPLNQFAWLHNELEGAKLDNRKVFIVSHVPPGASETNPRRFQHNHPHFNKLFLKMMQNYSDVIEAGFFGHQHGDAFKIIFNSKGEPVIPLLISPSISPIYMSKLGSPNPSLRLYFWNNNSAQSRYNQYHTRLPKSKVYHIKSLNWSLEYSSNSMIPGLSAEHLNIFSLNFSKIDSHSFDEFFRYHLSGRSHDYKDCPTNSACRCQMICGIRNVDYEQLDICLSRCDYKFEYKTILIVAIIFSLIVLCLIFGMYKVKNSKPQVNHDGPHTAYNFIERKSVMYLFFYWATNAKPI